MRPENGWWAPTGDWKACAEGLAAALDTLDKGGEELDAYRRAMTQAVARYSPQRLEEELLKFWQQELERQH
jgi:hypothetical protein